MRGDETTTFPFFMGAKEICFVVLMDRIEPESFRLFCPDVADEFVGREPFDGLEAPSEVVG